MKSNQHRSNVAALPAAKTGALSPEWKKALSVNLRCAVTQLQAIRDLAIIVDEDTWEVSVQAIEALSRQAGSVLDRILYQLDGIYVVGDLEEWFDCEPLPITSPDGERA